MAPLPLRAMPELSPPQIFNDSVDAYASWTLFLILISGVVLLTHKKPEASTHRDSGIALNTIPRQRLPRTADDKTDGREGVHPEDHAEDGQTIWDVGEVSDEEDERTTSTPRLESRGKAGDGEEGEHL